MLNEAKRTGISRCVFCQSTVYGKGCKYSANGVHFHPDDPSKCSYCGSTNYGPGCKYNPSGKFHVHGIEFNVMFKEAFKHNFFLYNLNKDFKSFEAYSLGLIDEQGNKIKEPLTEQENAAYSPSIRTILKIKKYLGSKLDLIKHTMMLESTDKLSYKKENHKQILEYEDKFNDIYSQLHKLTDNALKDGLTFEQIESLLNK